MNKTFIVGIIALVLIAGGFYLARSYGNSASTNLPSGSNSSENSGDVKTFTLTGENFKFVMNSADNPDLVVKQGDKVRIEFSSVGGYHDWVVDEFGAATGRVNDGGTTSVEFVASKKGTFEYYCSVGEHRAMGMKGNLIVE